MEQTSDNKLAIDFGFLGSDNERFNALLDEIREADRAGEKFNTVQVQELVHRVIRITDRYPVIGEIAEEAFIYLLTGGGYVGNARRVAPFLQPRTLRQMIEMGKHENRRY
ncbi:hypothetical protein [Desulfofustis glycolicus]|uniref:Uncharacterized protein n=1 Tax=Desulfofustis glycolicus DSM 9705 TaxID=1121409 RepID=A0A1M5YD69_9BACT|nr:hypothetical protein [Desulfofustis glycolicus]SHI09912.1 hypothetical protein SAMN02745124_03890 [Desulfofustis glycolicus DSM 9705]